MKETEGQNELFNNSIQVIVDENISMTTDEHGF